MSYKDLVENIDEEREKLLITRNFSFSHKVFISHPLQIRIIKGLSGKGLKKALSQGLFGKRLLHLSLPDAKKRLRSLSSRLEVDTHIKNDFDELVDKTILGAQEFQQGFKANADMLYVQGELVQRAQSPGDVNVRALEKALSETRAWFKSSHGQIEVLQCQVHRQIENCRGQVKEHKKEQELKNIQIQESKYKIKNLKQNIEQSEEEAREKERRARELDDEVTKLNEQAEENAKVGIASSAIQLGVGALFAPLTGGVSLLIGAAGATATSGITLKAVIDKEKEAKECRNEANDKRTSANKLRVDVSNMEDKIRGLRGDIDSLQNRIDVLEKALSALQDVQTFLRTSVQVSDDVIQAVQDMDTTLKESSLHGSTFEMARNSGKEKIVQKQLDKLKECWVRVQQAMNKKSACPKLLLA